MAKRKGPIRALIENRRRRRALERGLREVEGARRGLMRSTPDRELAAFKRGGIDEYIEDGKREMDEFSEAARKENALRRQLERVNERGPLQVFMQKRRLKRAADKQITAEERKKRTALKQVRAETEIWARPVLESRMSNDAERAAKARYEIVNAEYEARKARIADLEKRRRRIGKGGYGGQPKNVR